MLLKVCSDLSEPLPSHISLELFKACRRLPDSSCRPSMHSLQIYIRYHTRTVILRPSCCAWCCTPSNPYFNMFIPSLFLCKVPSPFSPLNSWNQICSQSYPTNYSIQLDSGKEISYPLSNPAPLRKLLLREANGSRSPSSPFQ